MNVAEHIYHRHDNLIVGRVDCTKYAAVCDNYQVKSYPHIAYLNKNTHVVYNGDRSDKSIIEFAERLNGPDVHSLVNCDTLDDLTNRKGIFAVFTQTKESDKLYKAYRSVAASQKSRFWFYQLPEGNNCKDLNLSSNNLYLIKRDLPRAIRFYNSDQVVSIDELSKSIVDWLKHNSIPVYGPVGPGNVALYLSNSKPLVLAVLDKYQPARKFSKPSEEFHEYFGGFVRKFIRQDQLNSGPLFGWTAELDFIRGLVIGQVLVPNVIIIQPNYTFYILINNEEELEKKIGKSQIPKKLERRNLQLALGKLDQLAFGGGNSYLHSLLRQVYSQYCVYNDIYRANPLLVSILVILPVIIMVFVIYTTCCYEDSSEDEDKLDVASSLDGDDEKDEEECDERQRLLTDRSHIKQE